MDSGEYGHRGDVLAHHGRICPRAPWAFLAAFLVIVVLARGVCFAGDVDSAAAARGYRLLRSKAYLPADFDQEVFDTLWKAWPETLRARAETATPAERRAMAYSRYGLTADPEYPDAPGPGLGYVANGKGGWAMTCLACHGGKVAGQVISGLPNSHFALETLTEEVRLTKLSLRKPLGHMDLAQLAMPLGTTVGTTNSVMFGVALGAVRNHDMSVDKTKPTPKLEHHDVDAPPFWNVRRKSMLYCDGFTGKNHRMLMQFILIPSNGKSTIESWEDDFRDILAWIESVEPPRYPFDIDRALADRGRAAFNDHCARCHGRYDAGNQVDAGQPVAPGKQALAAPFELKTIDLDELGTDPVRLRALQRPHREWMKTGWLSRDGADPVVLAPRGYVAPPLYGVWASAPYFHNGAAPTLWHVLHPDARPKVWTRTDEDGYDRARGGLVIESLDAVPESATAPADRRRHFDTTRPGKSAAGHRFPDALTEEEKRAVLEYLKTL